MMSFFLSLIMIFSADAKDLRFGGRKLFVPVKWEMIDPLNPSIGLKPTYLRFSKPVYRFDNITLFSLEAVSSKRGGADYREFKIHPRKTTGSQTVEIQLQDRTLVSVEFSVTKEDSIPLSYDFKPEKIPFVGEENQGEKIYTDVLVMKSVLLRKTLHGFDKKSVHTPIRCHNSYVKATILSHYEGHGLKILQIQVLNLDKKNSLEFNVKNVFFEKRNFSKTELKHFENEKIEPKKSTVVTFVVDSTAQISSLNICKIGTQLTKS